MANDNPFLALQNKMSFLNERFPPKTVTVGKKKPKKRVISEFSLPESPDPDNLKCIEMAKVQKLNLRYKIVDRGRQQDSE